MIPEVQYSHWKPPSSMNACRIAVFCKPSTVVIFLPTAPTAKIRQDCFAIRQVAANIAAYGYSGTFCVIGSPLETVANRG